jgi:hypothetical protein
MSKDFADGRTLQSVRVDFLFTKVELEKLDAVVAGYNKYLPTVQPGEPAPALWTRKSVLNVLGLISLRQEVSILKSQQEATV